MGRCINIFIYLFNFMLTIGKAMLSVMGMQCPSLNDKRYFLEIPTYINVLTK